MKLQQPQGMNPWKVRAALLVLIALFISLGARLTFALDSMAPPPSLVSEQPGDSTAGSPEEEHGLSAKPEQVGHIFGFPITCSGGSYQIVQGLELNDFSKSRLDVTVKELADERATVKQLDLV